ncbi:hypothetical protein NCCP2222_04180 [Sporosarcina sp. NCCP-2222]|uniref:hypothetical protein n=1 Tax=Sporosarcina sp. NCCP-2222 TaxID=2935073 RepID=UPI002089DB1A|nr:hypothetical protein [Sporosarcina sp. NCCP-2222]GKV54471.1 hypothetical protein NCCP2222_04180 [Sporosarcina sp. NCCP-2222]
MTRSFLLLLISFCTLFTPAIYATANDEPRPYEEIYPEIGYTTVAEALHDFEQHFKQKLKLPMRVPPIPFTHHFGRFSNLDGDVNDSFEVTFIHDQLSENHYKINVRPVKYNIPLSEKHVVNTYELENGTLATYTNFAGFNVLVFERNGWQYMLSIDKRVADKVTPETLVDIANSIVY